MDAKKIKEKLAQINQALGLFIFFFGEFILSCHQFYNQRCRFQEKFSNRHYAHVDSIWHVVESKTGPVAIILENQIEN